LITILSGMDISNSTYRFDDHENICISSDFDGIDDPLNLFASPRMYPIMVLYIANRLKWDLYRRYCVPSESYIPNNITISNERGQKLIVDEGFSIYLNDFSVDNIEIVVKEILIQILDRNYIRIISNSKGWS